MVADAYKFAVKVFAAPELDQEMTVRPDGRMFANR